MVFDGSDFHCQTRVLVSHLSKKPSQGFKDAFRCMRKMECLFCGCGNLRGAGDVDMGDEATQRGVSDAESVGVDEFYERQRRNTPSDPTSRDIEDHVTGRSHFGSRLKIFRISFFCISSKPNTTFSHGAQGMACSRRSRWLGPDHSWTAAEISPVASSIATATSTCRPWPATPATKAEPTRCENVRHSPVWHPSVKVTAALERVTKLESALADLDGVEGAEVDSLRTASKLAKEVKLLPLDVQVKECFDRVGCEAGHGEREHPGRRTFNFSSQPLHHFRKTPIQNCGSCERLLLS